MERVVVAYGRAGVDYVPVAAHELMADGVDQATGFHQRGIEPLLLNRSRCVWGELRQEQRVRHHLGEALAGVLKRRIDVPELESRTRDVRGRGQRSWRMQRRSHEVA